MLECKIFTKKENNSCIIKEKIKSGLNYNIDKYLNKYKKFYDLEELQK